MATPAQEVDINKLIEEVSAEISSLIKSEQSKIDSLKKADDKKEESSAEELEKEGEGSSYDNQSPEASAPAPGQDAPEESPSPEAPDQDQATEELSSIEDMLQGLDDEMLMELMQKVKGELAARQGGMQEPAPGQSPEPQMPAPQDSMPQPSPDAMAMKSEKDASEEKLIKAEQEVLKAKEEIQNLQKAVEGMTGLLDAMINRPVQKSVSEIGSVKVALKGDDKLAKSEDKPATPEDIDKAVTSITSDYKKYSSLAKSEKEAVKDYLMGKKTSPELLKIVNK